VWVSLVLLVLGIASLSFRGLDLGIDFEGGVSWDVPGSGFSIADAERILADNGLDPAGARIQERASDSGEFVKVQVGVQDDDDVLVVLQEAFAAVSASWGRSITEKAVRALVVFFVIVSLFIAWRFEWKMALAAFVAWSTTCSSAVGIYSLFGFEVTPATVVAFLTILGYSLYDTIVVFDKVKENTGPLRGSRVAVRRRGERLHEPGAHAVAQHQHLVAAPGAVAPDRRIAGCSAPSPSGVRPRAVRRLLVGAYSSLFIAAPVLALLKEREPRYRSLRATHLTGEAMLELSPRSAGSVRREHARTDRRNPTAGGATAR
jgi:preprotein translocase subunit SecF